MNKVASIALFALLLVPISALAENQTYPIRDMYTVRVAHVGDTIVITNTDGILHSITGKDSRGERIDVTLEPGQSTNIQFMFPVDFAFYDKYTHDKFGVIYTYDPNVDLSSLHVYNFTSIHDLFEIPQYSLDAQTTSDNITTTAPTLSFGFSNQTTPITTSSSSVSSNTTPVPINATQDNSTAAELKAVIAVQQSQIATLKNQLGNATNQISYWQGLAQQWEIVAERLAQSLQ